MRSGALERCAGVDAGCASGPASTAADAGWRLVYRAAGTEHHIHAPPRPTSPPARPACRLSRASRRPFCLRPRWFSPPSAAPRQAAFGSVIYADWCCPLASACLRACSLRAVAPALQRLLVPLSPAPRPPSHPTQPPPGTPTPTRSAAEGVCAVGRQGAISHGCASQPPRSGASPTGAAAHQRQLPLYTAACSSCCCSAGARRRSSVTLPMYSPGQAQHAVPRPGCWHMHFAKQT